LTGVIDAPCMCGMADRLVGRVRGDSYGTKGGVKFEVEGIMRTIEQPL
jgi:hypothetical protein